LPSALELREEVLVDAAEHVLGAGLLVADRMLLIKSMSWLRRVWSGAGRA
jgi:hypothetical protein